MVATNGVEKIGVCLRGFCRTRCCVIGAFHHAQEEAG